MRIDYLKSLIGTFGYIGNGMLSKMCNPNQ